MKSNKYRTIYWIIAALLMLSALTANQFSQEFNWGQYDFMVFAIMLLGAGLAVELVLRVTNNPRYRVGLMIVIALAFLLTWAELAVGVFH